VVKDSQDIPPKRPASLNILRGTVSLTFEPDIGKFRFEIIDPRVRHITLSQQLAYTLGFEKDLKIRNGFVAKYSYDLKGGVNHVCVYAKGLSESMILGDSMVSILRIVTVNGKPGDVIERSFDPPIYHKVITKFVNEIEIVICDIEGNPIPFEYGVVLVGLQFKKAFYL
jgi:hypothetical protein